MVTTTRNLICKEKEGKCPLFLLSPRNKGLILHFMASLRMLQCALREFRNRYAWQLPGAAGGFARNPEGREKSRSNKTIQVSCGVGPTRLFVNDTLLVGLKLSIHGGSPIKFIAGCSNPRATVGKSAELIPHRVKPGQLEKLRRSGANDAFLLLPASD